MATVVAFANNQVMSAIDGTAMVITTDPVPLNGNDRAAAMLNVHSIFAQSPATNVIAYQGQVSNDGVNWVNVTALTDNTNAVTATPRLIVATVNGAYIRFQMTFTVDGDPDDMGSVAFDLHVKLDHV
jgi:hypothetical protein